MKGTHEDETGSQWWYVRYRRGDIVQSLGTWGVVVESFYDSPDISWLVGGQWTPPTRHNRDDRVSAPYVHTQEGIPDKVLARATHYKLVDTDDEPDTTYND